MIIKLTEVRNQTKELAAIYVNTDQIQYFNKSMNGGDTRLKLADNAYIFVRETAEEIMDRMYPRMTTLPDSMDHAYGKDAHIIYGAR